MITTFWTWFLKGAEASKPGWRLLINRWLAVHALIGVLLTWTLSVSPYDFAGKALFPAASILIGMAVAWTSRAATILQDRSFRDAVVSDETPLEDYLYGYQLSLLIIIAMVVVVALVANRGFALPVSEQFAARSTAFLMYFLISIAIRECWTVINFSNLLSILHSRVARTPRRKQRGS